MNPPLPSGDTWVLYPDLAVIILVMAVIFSGLLIVWGQYKSWAREQDKKRSEERKTQREWQEEQDRVRDMRWQNFIQGMQQMHALESEKDRAQLAEMAEMIHQLSENSQKLAETVGHLSQTLTSHIAVDDARFDVLLSDTQKQAIQSAAPPSQPVKVPKKKP